MSTIPTMKIIHPSGVGIMIINKVDFIPGIHKEFVETPQDDEMADQSNLADQVDQADVKNIENDFQRPKKTDKKELIEIYALEVHSLTFPPKTSKPDMLKAIEKAEAEAEAEIRSNVETEAEDPGEPDQVDYDDPDNDQTDFPVSS